MERSWSFLLVALLCCLLATVHSTEELTTRPHRVFKGKAPPVSPPRGPSRTRRCALSSQSIQVRKEVTLPSGRAAICRGTITASSCYGECASQSVSSIHNPIGFNKKCSCCRETRMTSQPIVLSACVDSHDGEPIHGEEFTDSYKQPSECDCQPCTL